MSFTQKEYIKGLVYLEYQIQIIKNPRITIKEVLAIVLRDLKNRKAA